MSNDQALKRWESVQKYEKSEKGKARKRAYYLRNKDKWKKYNQTKEEA